MALSTYSDLTAAISDWLVGVGGIATQAPTFIALAEAELNRRLRCREQVTRSTASLTTAYTPLPTDYAEMRNVTLTANGADTPLRAITFDYADLQRTQLSGGVPQFFVISGDTIEIVPFQSPAAVEIVYFAKIPALATAGTNWLLVKFPDLYLAASLAMAGPYIRDPQWSAIHRGEVDRIIAEIEAADDNSQLGASPLIARTRRSY